IKVAPIHWAFFMPAIVLGVMFVVNLFAARNKPSDVSFEDIETGDASSGDTGPRLGAMAVLKLMLKSRVIMIIACIEFCSGFLRQAVMQNYRFFAKSMSFTDNFVYQNWGMTLCIAGILGGVFAGVISDRLYHSRRGPVAFALYAGMILGICGMFVFIGGPALGWAAAFVSLCVIGVHGMLSGTASMDFGGTRNVGVAVGIIDGFVYAGSGLQGLIYANILPKGAEAATVGGWFPWPTAMMPLAVIGLVLAFTIRNEKPKPKAAGGH
ncbi:MAG: MFS transporter, partial [bacterium]|nr:MFS transporter [bacterium]